MKFKNRFILLFALIFVAFTLIGVYTFFSFEKIKQISDTDKSVQNLKSLTLELKNHETRFRNWDLSSTKYYQYGKSNNLNNYNNTLNDAIIICNKLLENSFINPTCKHASIKSCLTA
ncbi:MAG: hypothetical protein K9G70_12395 [Prolixibacteraceae bacterium]|nr:hypothetical protein [Prolixibacteraceae bacterium]